MPQIRIFPHVAKVFPLLDNLTTWLLTSLKAKGGVYHVLGDGGARPAEMAPGSIVLFRHGDLIVGEAVIRQYELKAGKIESGEYQAVATFAPTSIRLYSPPVTKEELEGVIGWTRAGGAGIGKENAYAVSNDWSIYPRLLAHVATEGSFVSDYPQLALV